LAELRRKNFRECAALAGLAALLLFVPLGFQATPAARLHRAQPNIGINGFLSLDKVQRGRSVQAAIVMEIPQGYHVNSNRPLAKFSIPTVLKLEAPEGFRISPISYPRSLVRKFSFSEERLSVYEGRAVLRFNITVPAGYQVGVAQLRARLKYQSCTDEVCFPPVTREVNLPVTVIGANESSKNINGQLFGGRRKG
jgi:DsbC/DsbD-like thiol-disulfide interchange protein